ncbi:hypothetical protein KCP75_12260 [Salmonella enterica subsp. enterica]|nr:hypothetical protein KCP75_12260 [Salmonella enterica subsp. enterica]
MIRGGRYRICFVYGGVAGRWRWSIPHERAPESHLCMPGYSYAAGIPGRFTLTDA